MKYIKKVILVIIIFFAYTKIYGLTSYKNVPSFVNDYTKKFNNYSRYIIIENTKYGFKSGNIIEDDKYKTGGLINVDEYRISKGDRNNTYLFNGLEFFTMTKTSDGKIQKINPTTENEISIINNNDESSGVRVTAYVQDNVKLEGLGTSVYPWTFISKYKLTFKYDDTKITITPNTTMIAEGGKVTVDVIPSEMYMYVRDDCGGVLDNNKLTISGININNDTICTVETGLKEFDVVAYPNNGTIQNAEGWEMNASSAIKKVKYNKAIGVLPEVERTGYRLTGWYTETNGGTAINANTKITTDLTIYPHWNANKYTLTYDNTGGSGCNLKESYYDLKWSEVDLCTPSKTGYDFVSWNTNENGTGETITKDTVVKGDLTVYAQWTPSIYEVTLNKNGGSGGTNKIYLKYNTGWYIDDMGLIPIIEINKPTWEGHTFVGYTLASSGGTKIIDTTGSVLPGNTTIFNQNISNKVLYAQWLNNVNNVTVSQCINPTYNGQEQTIVSNAIAGYSWTSGTKKTNAGSQNVVATLNAGYIWSDGTTLPKTIICEIKEREITVTAANQSKIFDGSALNADSICTLTSGTLVSNHNFSCTNTGSQINVGSSKKTLNSVIVKNSSGTDVSSNYNITKIDGTLTVTEKILNIPSSPSDKTYTGGSQNSGITCPSGSNASGTQSATDAGTYSQTCTLSSTTNYKWSDGTTTAKNITWKILPKSLSVSWGSTTTFVYSGSSQAPTASVNTGVTGETMVVTGTTGTNVGNHTSTASCSSVTGGQAKCSNYTLTNTTKTFTITAKSLTIPSSPSDKTYSGGSQNSGITCPSGSNASGTQSATNVGTYTQTCTLSSTTNYKWSDDTTTAKIITWKINAKSIAVSWGSVTSFVYDGGAHAPTVSINTGISNETMTVTRTTETNVGSHTSTASCSSVTGGQAKCSNYTLTNTTKAFTITVVTLTIPNNPSDKDYTGNSQNSGISCPSGSNASGTQNATDAGSYTQTCTLSSTTNYKWSDGTTTAKNITWKINTKSVSVSWGTVSWIYDGSAHSTTASVTTGISKETMNLSISNNSIINVGTKTVTASCSSVTGGRAKCSNYTLTNTSNTLSVGEHTLTPPSSPSDKTYTGSSQNSGITCPSGSTAGGTQSATDVGTYTQTCTLSSTSDYKWNDGTTTAKSITWKILPKSLSVSWGSTTTFVYSGSSQAPTASVNTGVTGETMTVTRTTGIDVGNYTSTASCSSVTGGQAKCSNYTLTNTTKTFTITAKSLTITNIPSDKTYTGSSQNSGITCPSGSNSSGTQSATNAGAYTQTCTLSSTTNYKWSDGTTTAKNITWKILPKSLSVSWGSTTSFVYSGSSQAPTASVNTGVTGETMTVTRTTGTDVGNYTSTASCSSVTGGQAKCSNYTLTNTTKVFSITVVTLTAPSSPSDKTYTGSSQNSGITCPSGSNSSGTQSAINAGAYTQTCTLSSTTNYKWSDGTTTAKNITWKINTKSVSVSWGTTTSFVYSGSSQAPTASVNTGVTGETMTVTRTTGTDVGNYTSTASCSSVTGGQAKCSNYTLTNTTKTFTITAKSLTIPNIPSDKTYTGSSQNSGITCPSGSNSSGTQSATNAGAYTQTCTLSSTTNYKWSDGTTTAKSISWKINVKSISVSWGTVSWNYNGSNHSTTASATTGISKETMSLSISNNLITNAGTQSVTASCSSVTGGQAKCSNYTLTNTSNTLTVNSVSLTIPSAPSDKAYTGSSQSSGITCPSGSNASGTQSATNAGTYTQTCTLSSTTNYKWSDGTTSAKSITWKIKVKSISVSWGTVSWNYNGSDHSTTASATTGIINETMSLSISNNLITNVGTKTVTASCSSVTGGQAKCSNYTLTNTSNTLEVNAITLTVPSSPSDKTYTGSSQNSGITCPSGSNASGTQSATNAGTYTQTCTLSSTTNYKWSDGTTAAKSITWKINKKSVAVSWANTSFIYNGNARASAPSVTLVGGETMTNNTNYWTKTYTKSDGTALSSAPSDVGSYNLSISCKKVDNGQAKCSNYTFTNTSISYTINNATITFDKGNCSTISGTTTLYTRKGATKFYTGIRNSTNATLPTTTYPNGKKFDGWYTASSDGTKVLNANGTVTGTAVSGYTTTSAIDITENKTLYARCSCGMYLYDMLGSYTFDSYPCGILDDGCERDMYFAFSGGYVPPENDMQATSSNTGLVKVFSYMYNGKFEVSVERSDNNTSSGTATVQVKHKPTGCAINRTFTLEKVDCTRIHCTACAATCTACQSGYRLKNGRCESCTEIHSKCTACNSSGCTTCSSGYRVKNHSCEICTNVTANCATCNSSGCLTCKSGYTLSNGSCVSSGGGGGCFPKGTKVKTAFGLKNIEEIEDGTLVLAYNEKTGKQEYSKVKHHIKLNNLNEILYTLKFDDLTELKLTHLHRIYVIRNNQKMYVKAEDVKMFDKVLYADGTTHSITNISKESYIEPVYNLEVENNHNFYVGDNNVLVHNVLINVLAIDNAVVKGEQ